MKRVQAVIAATIITGLVAMCMLLVGINAFFNPNAVQASNAPVGAIVSAQTSGTDQTQVAQLQNQLAQYQQQLDQANAEIQQANGQLQQYQQILQQLQQSGVIRVTRDGRILLPAFSGRGGDDGN